MSMWQRANRETVVLASTTCPLRGSPRVVVSPDVSAEDSQPVRIHEEVHAAQCRALGPWRYRWRNLTRSGKLGLEAPAYCAAADARLRAGLDTSYVTRRLVDDATEALRDVADARAVRAALRHHCEHLVREPTS
jgi:hypothetical protein